MDGAQGSARRDRIADSFLYAGNAVFVSQLYEQFLKDPHAVDPSWRAFFAALGEDERAALTELTGPSWAPKSTRVIGADGGAPALVIARRKPVNVRRARRLQCTN